MTVIDALPVPPEIPPLGIFDLYAYLGLVRVMEPETEILMRERAERERQEHDYGPHERPWFVSFHGCLAGDTEVVTREGIREIRNLVGTHELLIPSATKCNGLDREGRGQRKRAYNRGGFQKVQVSSYGYQELYAVKLRRGRQKKIVKATGPHRWMLKTTEMVSTLDLEPGDKLKGIRARRVGSIKMVPFAVAQGFVFGDGTARRLRRDTAWLDLHHNGKDEAMLDFFHGHKTVEIERDGRMSCTQIQGLPRLWKLLPSFEESSAFLLSWLAGYFAADGSVSKSGQATLTSASRSAIDAARGILSICGASYGAVKVAVQSGTYPHGAKYENKTMYSLNFNVRDLPQWFFVLPKHCERAQARLDKEPGRRHEWEVISVKKMRDREQVYCATVPGVGCFALSDELLTGNSEFPGEPMDACKRYLLYRMMDLPPSEIVPPWVTTTGKIGKTGELDLADAWWQGGRLLAIPEDDERKAARLLEIINQLRHDGDSPTIDALLHEALVHQLGFVNNSLWFTVSTDLPILQKGWRRPHIVEAKCKADDVLDEMLQGRIVQQMDGSQRLVGRGPDASHVNQLKATIGEAHDYDWGGVVVCAQCWFIIKSQVYERLGLPDGLHPSFNGRGCPRCGTDNGVESFMLEPPISGEVYYWSRSWPRKTKSFYYEYDAAYMAAGRAVLAETRQHFLDDVLPARPDHFQWSAGPCKDCIFKPTVCRLDAGVPGRKRKPDPKLVRTTLSGSNGVEYAQALRDGYDYDKLRARVLEEWEETAPPHAKEQS